jgi:hypothetical protein
VWLCGEGWTRATQLFELAAMDARVSTVIAVMNEALADHALGAVRVNGQAGEAVVALVSLVSVSARNWCYSCGNIERVETGETLEIASIDAVFMQVA